MGYHESMRLFLIPFVLSLSLFFLGLSFLLGQEQNGLFRVSRR